MSQKITSKKPRGRPPKPDGMARKITVHARVTIEEKAKLDAYLKEKNFTLTELIIKAVDGK